MINHASEAAYEEELPLESVSADAQRVVDSPEVAEMKQKAADLAAKSVEREEIQNGRVPTWDIKSRIYERYRFLIAHIL